MNTLMQVPDASVYIGALVIDTICGGFVVLVDIIPNCHWGCEVRRSDGTLAYRALDELKIIPQVSALRPFAAPVVA